MNLKKLFLMLTFFVLLGTTAFAQTTWYVNNGPSGNDGRNGLSATIPVPDDFVTGPKKTISNAISSANASDVLVLAYTGVDYGPGTGEPATITVNKALKFQSTGGAAPNISSVFEVATGALATSATFNSGNINLKGGILLTSGTLDNSNGLVTASGGTIAVAAVSTVAKVNGQLAFSGTVNWNYTAAYTTAAEFPNTGGTINNFAASAAVTIKSGASVTMTGLFNISGVVNLNSNTWTITNTADANHTVGANITTGTLAFSIGGTALRTVTIAGAGNVPTVTVANSTDFAHILDVQVPQITGSLSISGKAVVTATTNALTTIGTTNYTGNALTLSGVGTFGGGTSLVTIHGNVLLTSTGVKASNAAQINFANTAPITINGNVTNDSGVELSGAGVSNAGLISFPDQGVTINGNVALGGSLSGNSIAATNYTNNGDIRFGLTVLANGAVTITGLTTNSATSSAVATVAGGTVSDNFRITFASTTAVTRLDGGVTNSTQIPAVNTSSIGCTNTGNGVITIANRSAGDVGTSAKPVGTVSNTSVSTVPGNGLINFGVAAGATGKFWGTSIAQGSGGKGGDITFGDHDIEITGNITSGRTDTGAEISTNAAAGATVTYTVGGYIQNSGKSAITIMTDNDDVVAITGRIENTGTGSVTFSSTAATAGVTGIGGITASAGAITFTNHNATLTISGAVDISGTAAVNLSSTGAQAITVTGDFSFTKGDLTTTNRSGISLSSTNITIGGATTNPNFVTATPITIVNPASTQLVNFMIGGANPVIPGNLTVNITNGLAKAIEFSGGSLVLSGQLYLQAGKANLAGAAVLIVQSTGANSVRNTAGYTTDSNARVMVNGAAPDVAGAGDFGNIEFNTSGTSAIVTAAITVKGTLYLTGGVVNNTANNIKFNNTTTIPTIVRNAGSFTAVPDFISNVNVTYIGGDKVTGNELPGAAATTKLQNLTVSTTSGGSPVSNTGAVTIGGATTVNGTLTINANQALVLNGVALTMKGASIVLNGDLTNFGGGALVLAATNGTTIAGSGYLPDVQIATNSHGNVIGAKALIANMLGNDHTRGGAGASVDVDLSSSGAQASGSLTFNAASASATLNLTGVAKDGTDLLNISTNAAGTDTLTLAANTQMAGSLTHPGGVLNMSTFNLTHGGTAASVTGGSSPAVVTGSGKLIFITTGTTFTAATGNLQIDCNVELAAAANADTWTLAAGGNDLAINGNLTLTKGDLIIGNGRVLTVVGQAMTMTANSTVDNAGAATGTLKLSATTPPLTLTFSGSPTIRRLQVSNDVKLAGSNAVALTVASAFTHSAGILDFGDFNLTIKSAFARTAGTTYIAGAGYMILDANAAWTVNQGSDGFSIPNLKVTASSANNLSLTSGSGAGVITVTKAFDQDFTGNTGQTFTTNSKLAFADSVTVTYTSGLISAAPSTGATINFVAKNMTDNAVISDKYWPNTPALVTNFTVNSAASTDRVQLPGSRQVNGSLYLTRGVLTLGSNTCTLASGIKVYRTEVGSATKGSGGFAFPSDNMVNLTYRPTTASAGGDITTGIEFPGTMNDLTVTRTISSSVNPGNAVLTVGSAATVNGTLAIRNDFTASAQLTVVGNTTITTDSNSNATAPVVNFTAAAPLVFGGTTGQTLSLPSGGAQIGYIKLNLIGTNPVLVLAGGNLTISNTGAIILQNGILDAATNNLIVVLPRPASATQFNGLAFDRPGLGHIAGKVSRFAQSGDGASGFNGRFEFPTGSLTGEYRPCQITFTPSTVVVSPANIVVSHVNSSPQGTVNLPLDGGGGVKIGNYPPFYWLVSTSPSSFGSEQKFSIDLQANNIGYPYTSDQNLRMIRRQDGNATSNGWSMQGTVANYSNYQVVDGTDTTVFVRTSSTIGGLVAQGSRFTIGVPTRAPIFTAPTALTATVNEGDTLKVQFTADAQDVGETVTYALVGAPSWASINATSGLATLMPGYAIGSATPYNITVRATDTGGATADITIAVTVVDANRPPVLTTAPATATIKYGSTLTLNYVATDADGDAVTYSVASAPAPSVAPTITAAGGVLSFTPAFADAGKSFTLKVVAADAAASDTATTVVTVGYAKDKGDVDLSGSITAADATPILKYVVGLDTLTAEQKYYANVDGDTEITALDAAWILYRALNPGSWPSSKVVPTVASAEFGQLSKVAASNSIEVGSQVNNGEYSLPIAFKQTSGVISVYAEFQLSGEVEFKSVNPRLPEGWQYASSFENGVLKVAMAGINPLTDGNVATINIRMKDKEATGSIQGFTKLNDNLVNNLNAVKVKEIPAQFAISQNYPNPFNPTTSIKFQLPENANVSLEVYNMLGQKVKTLINGEQESGYYTVNWDGTNEFGSKVSSGIYIYRIIAGKYVSTMKMNLLK